MGYITNDKYKNNIYNEDSIQNIEIIINNIEVPKKYVKSINYVDNIFENDVFSLGSAVTSKYEIELNQDFLLDVGNFNEIKLQFKLNVLDETMTIPLGNYIVHTCNESSKGFLKYTLYDYMKKFEIEFDASEIVPCTRFELLQAICNHCGVELENTSIINGNIIVGVYDNTITAKNYLSLISERAGGFAKINKNNKLVIKSFADVDTYELPENRIGEYTTDEKKTITKIIYENGIQKFENGTNDGEIIFLSPDSPFSCSQEEVDNLFNILNGLEFQSLDIRVWGDPSIDTGDIITYKGIKSFAQPNWSFGNGFFGNYKTTLKKCDKLSKVEKISNSKKINRLKSDMNELDGKIKILVENIKSNEVQLEKLKITDTSETNPLVLINSAGKDLIELCISGRSVQKIRSGKNLLNNTMNTQTINGITFTVNEDKSITINGTATARTEPNIWTNSDGSLTLSKNIKYYNYTGDILYFFANGKYFLIDDNSFLEPTEDLNVVRVYIRVENGEQVNKTIYPMLTTSTDNTYEQYGVSPSPDYPSEIESVGTYNNDTGKYEIEIINNGKNFLNVPNNYELTGYEKKDIKLKPGNYIITWDDIVTNGSNQTMLMNFFYEDGTSYARHISNTYPSKSLSFNPIKNVSYVNIYSQTGYNNSLGVTTAFTNLMISIDGGNYEPFQGGMIKLSLDEPLRGFPNGIRDELIVKDGKLSLIKNLRHLRLSIADMNNSENYPGWKNQTQLKEDYPNLNAYFSAAGINMLSNITDKNNLVGLNTTSNKSVLWLRRPLFDNMTQTEIKAKFPDLVFDLYYELKEPQEIDLGRIIIPTLYGNSKILIDSNLDPSFQFCRYYLNSDSTNHLVTREEHNSYIEITGEKIENNTKEILTISDSLGNIYTQEQVNNLIQNASAGLTNVFTQSGGSNLLRNTQPFAFKDNDEAEFWTGKIKQINEISSVSGFAILTQQGTASQSVTLVNGTYSLSFKYKRLIDSAECSVRYNGRTFNLNENSGEIHSSGEITTGQFIIEIIANSNDGFEIYDLMLKHGSEGEQNMLIWTQNANESISNTVQISEGITAISSQTDTKSTMNSKGFMVRNKTTGTSVMEATSTGGKFLDLISTGNSNISGLLVKKVGSKITINGESGS